ncbi:MAG: primosomal protein N' [Candidatus Saccharibacteria bacterium]|nr:primosomal protein N' [Candidatus Saccharibacteria bacterium]
MNYYLVAVNQVVSKQHDRFTYSSDLQLSVGQIVQVPIGKKTAIGIVLQTVSKPDFATKNVIKSIESQPLPRYLLKTLLWMQKFYLSPLANIIQTALPTGITKQRRDSNQIDQKSFSKEKASLSPTAAQSKIIQTVLQSNQRTFLLHGVTGSGKTTVYIELAKRTIAQNKSVIVIIPEISLTTQLTQQFSSHFNNVVIFHSNLTESIRHQIWQKCLNSEEPLIIVGTRSSLFLPLKNLGLIIIDEAHEISSLRQDKNPKYSSVQVATIFTHYTKAKLILGSATPSVNDYWFYEQKNYSILELTETALTTVAPRVLLIDMRQKNYFSRSNIISRQLIESIKNSLKNNQQALIFHNRRGSTSATFCKQCGWTAECPNCHIPLTLHHDNFQLHCHVCNHQQSIPIFCPECGSADIEHRGIGTKLIESELKRLFPSATIRRFDADTPDSQSVANSYNQLRDGEIDILIGTQVIAKGLNLPNLTTVGVIQADVGLSLPDFVARERTFQLLTQVIGRVGRNQNRTNVIVQSYQPDNPIIQLALSQNYPDFYRQEIKQRRQDNYPPFCFLLKLSVAYKTERTVIKHADQLATKLRTKYTQLNIIGPAPSFYERRGDKYYWQIIIKSKKRSLLQEIISELPPNWFYDLDSASLI